VTSEEIAAAVQSAGLPPLPEEAAEKFASYLALLLKWNAKLNLTAIREPSEIIRRHFVECIQCAQCLPPVSTLLDFGSGAGFPGIPIALLRPWIEVTLGESQAKKAAFLREAVRVLELKATVFDGRIETMDVSGYFEAITLRAVDKMAEACSVAQHRLQPGGWLVVFATPSTGPIVRASTDAVSWANPVPLAGAQESFLLIGQKGA